MKRGRKAKVKDPADGLPEEFVAAIQNGTTEDVKKLVCQVALDQHNCSEEEKADQQLQEARAAAKEAGAFYKERSKLNKSKIKFARDILAMRGERHAQMDHRQGNVITIDV